MDRVSSWPVLSVFLHFRAPKGLAKSARSSHSRRKKDAGKCGHLPKAGGQCSQQLLQCNLDTSPNLQYHQGRDNHWESENMYLMNKTSVGIKAYPGNSQSPTRSFKHRPLGTTHSSQMLFWLDYSPQAKAGSPTSLQTDPEKASWRQSSGHTPNSSPNTHDASKKKKERKQVPLPPEICKFSPQKLWLGRKGHAKRDYLHGLTYVGHPGTGKKNVKASQMLSSIRMKSHWGQLKMMSRREKQLLSWVRSY